MMVDEKLKRIIEEIDDEKLSMKDLLLIEEHLKKTKRKMENRMKKEYKKKILKMAEIAGLDVEIRDGARRKYGPAKIKYRHPDDPEMTWSGRGIKPRWVRELESQGYTLDQLRVPEEEHA